MSQTVTATISGRMIGRIDGHTNYASYSFPVANGVTVNPGDFVYFSSGYITNASVSGARLIGMCEQKVVGVGTQASTNFALVCIDPQMRYLLQNDNVGTTFAVTHVGQYFNLTGAAGAQLVDTSTVSATLGELLCLEYNPQIDPVKSDTTYGIFKLVNSALSPYVANS